MIYLDNAATTLIKPTSVYDESDRIFRNYSANPGRSGHTPSVKALEKITSAREEISEFLGIERTERTVFTFGCTDALNMLIKGLFTEKDSVLTTAYEHNSVLRPLEYMRTRLNTEYTVIFPDKNGNISAKSLEEHLKKNTKALIMNYVSNVNGYRQDIESASDFCKKHGLLFIVDCAQAAGTQELSVKDMHIDYIACAGHKGLYGPQGIGVLGISANAPLPKPLRTGGTGSRSQELIQPPEMPEYLESGTLSVQNISALAQGVRFAKAKRKDILNKECELAFLLHSELKKDKNIRIYSPEKPKSGVFAFNIGDADSMLVADILDKHYGICCRGGFHCAPLVHKFLNTEKQGAVRLSIGYFNTSEEILSAVKAVKEISKRI